MNLIDWADSEFTIKEQTELLSLDRTGLYYKPVPIGQGELEVGRRIDEIFTESPFFGSRRITAVLRREGTQINRKAVQRFMGEMGLVVSP